MPVEEKVEDNTNEQAAIFAVLSDPTRLRLVKILCRQNTARALCVNALAGILGVTQSAVSQHLRILKSIGLVKGERRGYYIHYYINPAELKRCQHMITKALAAAAPSGEDSCRNSCAAKDTSEQP